jgi:DNA-directed RNA polymerase
LVDGGYYLKRGKSALKLLRIRKSDNFKQNVHNDLSKVFTCVNSIQNTPWTINKFILEVLQQEHLDNELDTIEVPEPLADTQYDFQRLMLQMPKTMRRNLQQRSVALGRITRIKSQIFAKKQSIDIAERMQKYPAIYFPHTLDYRGRVYPVPAYLHPQGDDVAKGLLMFADGKPLGEHGAKWLAIHGANSWGNNVDKLPFKQRLEWIRSNTHLILESASEPLKTAFWRDAEDPYQFLAFCKEWQGYQQQGKNFVSHLSINLDGSCNGLQHLSSLMKDSIGGSFVNLLPSESPHDVYTIVKEHTIETVEKDAREGNEIAKEWVGKVDRKIVKRPTMTQGYGVTLSGVKNQIKDEVKKRGKEYAKIQDNVFMYADYLAGIIYNSISEIMPGVTKAKEFLREIAKIATESSIPLKWTVPTGLCVLQEKLKQKQIKVDSFYGVAKLRGSTQKSCRITLNQDTDKLDKSEQMNAIVPNIIHSLDACHLMMVVNKCREVGIKDFAAIHDSFGTHACNVEELQKIIREEFVNLYKGNVLKDLFDQFQSQIPAKLPEPPEMGTLDIHQVMDSQYFFA